jgi:sugar lactone lactonase YvrE
MGTKLRLFAVTCVITASACSNTMPPAASATASTTPASISATETAAAAKTNAPSGHAWSAPEVVVAGSAFHGVHGLAIDAQGRLLAGTVVGSEMWEVDRNTGAAKVFIPAPEGEADDIAIGPKGELAWTSYTQGIIRYRENDAAPIRELAKDLAGINSLAFDKRTGKLYASQVFYGDALWEIDVAGKNPPRLIKKDLGGFNGFEVGPDGRIYGPLWFKGQAVKINPSNGNVTVLNSQFKTPAAANLDSKLNLYVIDTQTGVLSKIELGNGKRTDVKTLATSLDNLAIAPDGMIYVSNMADNSVVSVAPATGETKTILSGKLAVPAGIKLDGDTVYVADVFAFRAVDTKSGDVRDIYRAHASHIEYPGAVGIGSKLIALSSWVTGSVQLLDRATQKEVETVHGLKAPTDAIPMDDGSLLVLELGTGSLLKVSGDKYAERTVVAKDLVGPNQMVLGKDGAVYVTEAAGKLTRIELTTGAKTSVADGLAMPEGLSETPWGTFVVAESGAKRLTEIDPKSGAKNVVAENLPIGLPSRAGMPPGYLATGVAVAADGTLYVTSDLNNSLLRLRPKS